MTIVMCVYSHRSRTYKTSQYLIDFYFEILANIDAISHMSNSNNKNDGIETGQPYDHILQKA